MPPPGTRPGCCWRCCCRLSRWRQPTFGWVDEYVAYYVALWIGVLTLAVIGWVNSERNHGTWPMRLLNTLITTAFGLAVIWLSSLVH